MVDLEDESKASMAKIALRIWKGAEAVGTVITLALGNCAQAILGFGMLRIVSHVSRMN